MGSRYRERPQEISGFGAEVAGVKSENETACSMAHYRVSLQAILGLGTAVPGFGTDLYWGSVQLITGNRHRK